MRSDIRHVPRRNRVGLTDEVHGIHGVAEKLRHDRRAIRAAPPRCGGRDLAESTERAAACERIRFRFARVAELVHHEIADTPSAVRREAPTNRARPVVDPGAQPRSSDNDLLLVLDPVAGHLDLPELVCQPVRQVVRTADMSNMLCVKKKKKRKRPNCEGSVAGNDDDNENGAGEQETPGTLPPREVPGRPAGDCHRRESDGQKGAEIERPQRLGRHRRAKDQRLTAAPVLQHAPQQYATRSA